MKKEKKIKFIEELLKMKDVDIIFDLICFYNFILGDLGKKSPVEESRLVFEHIKSLLGKMDKKRV